MRKCTSGYFERLRIQVLPILAGKNGKSDSDEEESQEIIIEKESPDEDKKKKRSDSPSDV